MAMVNKEQQLSFQHVVLEGSAYEIGRQQGEMCKQNPDLVKFMTSPLPDVPVPSKQEITEIMHFCDQHCPGLNEEIRGFADSLGVSPEEIVYYSFSFQGPAPSAEPSPQGAGEQLSGHCSQAVVLPSQSKDGRMYVARSYEWGFQDDFRLVTTRVRGRAAHIGFSLLLFGRIDGFNEHGLVVTMSAGAPMAEVRESGFRFWVVIRTLLDRCRSVEEALTVLQDIPISFNLNLMLADKSGHAALVEIFCSHRAVKRIGSGSDQQVLISTNHYNHPDMLPYDVSRMWQSVVRQHALEQAFQGGAVDKEDIRRVLSSPLPEGVCCHYYEDGLGTLWSVIYDVLAGEAEVALGSPQCNPWRRFGLGDAPGVSEYPAVFPLEQPVDPKAFYRRLAPGAQG